MKKVVVTGGCGFIGSNFIKYILTSNDSIVDQDIFLINIDKQTYAGQGKNLENMGLSNHKRYKFFNEDISDKKAIDKIFELEKPDFLFNFAAESHVDRSIISSEDFIKTNIEGTANLLESSKKFKIKKFTQISTDEIYGSINKGSFDENSNYHPTNPYSASKASAELLVLSYFLTFKLPIIITRSANNYGPYQFPEKILPLFITNLIDKKKVPLMWSEDNPGLNVRDWLNVEDNCSAIWFIFKNSGPGETYNIPGENETKNIDITRSVLSYFNFGDEMIERVPHRKNHDFRYSISGDKLKKLGFRYNHQDLNSEIKNLCKWYCDNENWWRPIKNERNNIR